MSVRNIFDREKRMARRERMVSMCAWSCFVALALLALDNFGLVGAII